MFALYYLGDPKLVELGLVPSFDVAKAEYAQYVMNGMMTQLTRIRPGKTVEEAHMRNRKLIAEWCYEKGRADNVIEKVVKDGKTYIVVNDYEKLRTLFGDLLREIQRIKSTGDFAAGQALVETYGVQVDPALHKEVLDRYAKLKLEPYAGFVNPVYKPVHGERRDRRRADRVHGRLSGPDDGVLRELFVPAVGQLIGRSDSELIGNLFACGRTGNGSPSARLLSVCRQSCCRPFSRFGRCDRISSVPVRL